MQPHGEWLETDGLGGFASGTTSGERTRRYHAILLHAATPPTGRAVLVNGFDAWLETPEGRFDISMQRYAPDVTHPAGATRLVAFQREPWPQWTYRLENGIEVVHELFAVYRAPVAALSWRLSEQREGVTLHVRPFLSGRDTHSLHRENPDFRFDPILDDGRVSWQPYAGLPRITAVTNGAYGHEPLWYRNFQYDEERARGLDHLEDLASPGTFRWDLGAGEAVWIVCADGDASREALGGLDAMSCVERLRTFERARRTRFATPLLRAADQYLARRGDGLTIVAGYPWFSDWGRDTFIALRGLCIATGRLDEARRILTAWAASVSEGMLPNYFPEQGREPEYNSVDASLWFVVAVHELLRAAAMTRATLPVHERIALERAVEAILNGYTRGTRFGIHADTDGLLAAGERGQQLTWMDARVDGREITPRIGKAIEVQALWINALRIGSALNPWWEDLHDHARASFVVRFWDATRGWLADVVDVDHVCGTVDATLRPNQILAVAGLPFPLLDLNHERERTIARAVVDVVERELLTPIGLRSLAPAEPGYTPTYAGGVAQRDGSYHQGTVWPWLIGPFIEAWVRVRGGGDDAIAEARARFLPPLLAHLDDAGLGHVSEIADAGAPHTPRGAPFQAWSVGELLRLLFGVLLEQQTCTCTSPSLCACTGESSGVQQERELVAAEA